MRHLRTVALVVVLVAAACGGDSDGDNDGADRPGGDSGSATTTDGGGSGSGSDPNFLSADFDLEDLPENFPAELVPPSWTAGQATDMLGPFAVNFRSDMDFAEAVAYYDGIFGPSSPIVGDPGEQLAQWTDDPTWIASIFDGDPMTIGFVDVTE